MKTFADLHQDYAELSLHFNARRIPIAWTRIMLALADLGSTIFSIWIAQRISMGLGFQWERPAYAIMSLALIVFGSTYILIGHYRSINVNQVEELRHLSVTTTIIFMILFTFNLLMSASIVPPLMLGLSWLFTIVMIPLARLIIRWIGTKLGIWGEPVVVIGNGSLSRKVVAYLLKNAHCGMKPVLVVDGLDQNPQNGVNPDFPIPVTSLASETKPFARPHRDVRTAIIVAPDLPAPVCEAIARGEHYGFTNIITITNTVNTRNFGLKPVDFGGVMGFEERHYELNRFEDRLIRIFDLLLVLFALPILAPVFLLIITAIKVDSRGSVFYRQARIGKSGKPFKVLKFRTMVQNADQVLARYLQENPRFRAEWDANHKLKDDPRITRVGKFLRKASLDEFPQLWNVIKGEMSLVGPRPIVTDEIKRYGDRFIYYAQVPPGLSGLWQVSGRNDTGYQERVSLDEYYVRNRSIWMNLHIIIRTILVVIRRNGAY